MLINISNIDKKEAIDVNVS